MDLYAVLGIPKDADELAIRTAYRLLARRYHPDTGSGSSPEKFREVAEAYETLIDPARRHGYDLSLPRVAATSGAAPVRVEPTFQYPQHPDSTWRRYPASAAEPIDLFAELLRAMEQDTLFLLRRRRW
jgi:curved DNA-binding protein CbpA